uniref:DAZ-associated protein 2 n=1 Tax=Steinernema glaseri TaxID=37863 RepID=A0A1I7ZUG6_9BILA
MGSNQGRGNYPNVPPPVYPQTMQTPSLGLVTATDVFYHALGAGFPPTTQPGTPVQPNPLTPVPPSRFDTEQLVRWHTYQLEFLRREQEAQAQLEQQQQQQAAPHGEQDQQVSACNVPPKEPPVSRPRGRPRGSRGSRAMKSRSATEDSGIGLRTARQNTLADPLEAPAPKRGRGRGRGRPRTTS